MTTTCVPTSTCANRSVMSWLSMRMQPYEANLPIDSGLFVPWMAYSPPESVMAATPIGLLGAPPGITSGRAGLSALTSAGGVQAGLDELAADPSLALPLLAGAIDRDGVADRLAAAEHEIELPFSRLDHDRAGLDLTVVAHHLAGTGRGG